MTRATNLSPDLPGEAGEALRTLAERHRQLADNLPDGFIYQVVATADGGIRFWYASAGVEPVCGIKAADLAADPQVLYDLVLPEDMPALRAAEEEALRVRGPFNHQFRLRGRGGEVRWLHCRSAPRFLPDGRSVWDGIAVDITERVRAEDGLRRERELLQAIYDALPVMMTLYDPDTRVRRVNPEFERLTGWTAGPELVEQCYPDPADAEEARRFMQACAPVWKDFWIRTRDGRRLEASWTNIRLSDGRQVGIGLDVGERRAAETALREADRRKDEFLAMLGHELRNPLAPIRNGLVVLRQRAGDDPATGRVLGMMERQVAHAVRLIDDLLDVSRVTRGQIELRKECVVLADVLARALEETRGVLEERRHQLELVVPPEPMVLDADPVRLQQIITNLLTNAAKYTPSGGRVALWAAREGEQAVVRVRDSGIGIRPEMLGRIFELFTQADRVEGRVSEGLGLGLPLVKKLAELHRGTVEAHSAGPGRGSEFVVRLPLVDGGRWAVDGGEDSSPSTAHRPPPTARRILVVDDNWDAAESVAMLLRLRGHEVKVAFGGGEALGAFGAFAPQVVLLDIGMPDISGYEVARRIRAQAGSRGVLVVAVSGYGQDEDRRRAREAGFDHHLVKPVDLDVLLGLLDAHPSRRQEAESP
jgi:PAS domain S-box-containing protein